MKPVIRWTIGSVKKTGYEILYVSIKKILSLYSNEFDYFVFYNDINLNEIEKLKIKFKNIEFVRQKWQDCPINLAMPNSIDKETKQKLNGSFWKICPPRIRKDAHEIILDNDLVFLKKPKIIKEFLSRIDKNLVVQDCLLYMGKYGKYINEKQGYNSGIIGLRPNYDFESELKKEWNQSDDSELDYAEEQGLVTYTLLKSDCLIASSEDFVGIHPEHVYLNSLSFDILDKMGIGHHKKMDINKRARIRFKSRLLNHVIQNASIVHFLRSNRESHKAWSMFRNIDLKIL